ncbi:MAG: hypothetical protein QMD09_05050, partial [Desulfatibacillaceae bacterium]|nr:hypothetical protein [Desulfatibacillaceae bacterium]
TIYGEFRAKIGFLTANFDESEGLDVFLSRNSRPGAFFKALVGRKQWKFYRKNWGRLCPPNRSAQSWDRTKKPFASMLTS